MTTLATCPEPSRRRLQAPAAALILILAAINTPSVQAFETICWNGSAERSSGGGVGVARRAASRETCAHRISSPPPATFAGLSRPIRLPAASYSSSALQSELGSGLESGSIERRRKESEMARLRLQLNEARERMQECESRFAETDRLAEALIVETERERVEGQGIVSRMRDMFE